jgi:flagellar basal-body rod modification protein FlgD
MNTIGSLFGAQTTSTSNVASDAFTKSSNTYLQLFLTQLKNQDPTQPFETKDMTQQLSQLTNSQQLIETNKNLERLIATQNNSNASSLSSFINKEVEYQSDKFSFDGTNKSEIGYIISGKYTKTNVEILNDQGKVIFQKNGEISKGRHDFVWDGKDKSGNAAKAGKYQIRVSGLGSNEKYEPQNTVVKGIVSGIDFASSAEPLIEVGSGSNLVPVELSRIASVSNVISK